MATKRILFSETAIDKLSVVTMADKKADDARKLAADTLAAVNKKIDDAIDVERTHAVLYIDKAETAAATRTIIDARNVAIEKLEKERATLAAMIKDELTETLAATNKKKAPIYKLVSSSMYAATMGYNYSGAIGYIGKVPTYDHKGNVVWLNSDKSLVTCWKELFIALGCRKVDDLTTAREIRRFIAITSGSRSNGYRNNYKRRSLSETAFRKECIDALIGYMVNGTHEMIEYVDRSRAATVTEIIEYAPRYKITDNGQLVKA